VDAHYDYSQTHIDSPIKKITNTGGAKILTPDDIYRVYIKKLIDLDWQNDQELVALK
jgi:hypothetical protein